MNLDKLASWWDHLMESSIGGLVAIIVVLVMFACVMATLSAPVIIIVLILKGG